MNITALGGHSGCKILLYELDDGKTFVRKISSDKDYNKRLIVQAQKQKEFNGLHIKTPVVLGDGYDENGLFYFDMEYIQGITLSEYMKTIEIGKVRKIVEMIIDDIISNKQYDYLDDDSVFIEKISTLKEKLKEDKNVIISQAVDILSNHNWHFFGESFCHGDLTLENIIVKGEQLYYIDFLDSFYDCWIIDICTLLQDVQAMWAYRKQDNLNINTLLRLIVFKDILIDKVKESIGENYIEIYYSLLLKLLRIYPYVTDDKTYEFLNDKTKMVIDLIKKEENKCEH